MSGAYLLLDRSRDSGARPDNQVHIWATGVMVPEALRASEELRLDGVPYSFATRQVREGRRPNLANIFQAGTVSPLNSSWPFVSSVAWSSFMTGCNPGQHNIYGFVDRKPNSYDIFLPNSSTMKREPIWCELSQAGKQVVVMNVSVT